MASVVSSMYLHGSRKYPWHLWFNGEIWELQRGVDFNIDVEGFRGSATRTAREMGFKVKTRRNGDKITIQRVIVPGTAADIARRIREQKESGRQGAG